MALGNGEGGVGGAGVDNDDLVAQTLGVLGGDGAEQGVEVLGLVKGADDEA
ncbi:hypothetical protein Thiowin_00165 [Thiorhodovibrio winogradskyi]|uniref:Uncharacterized protein n=1 Tax=Thiorhodovibrio winogradskyi TaxID=77007 RepID=A0ABZ0S730_9GAMM|nr:hypothetical protein [Thiorhodovibrio winogradskyi]